MNIRILAAQARPKVNGCNGCPPPRPKPGGPPEQNTPQIPIPPIT